MDDSISESCFICDLLRPNSYLWNVFMTFGNVTITGLRAGSLRDYWYIVINRWWKKMNIVELSSKGIFLRKVKTIQFYCSGNWILLKMM